MDDLLLKHKAVSSALHCSHRTVPPFFRIPDIPDRFWKMPHIGSG
jgi:hypothetical protein